jgi:calcium-translocating P-type ATPase
MKEGLDMQKLNIKEVFESFQTSENGLSNDKVKENQNKYGKNLIHEKNNVLIFVAFIKNFIHLMAILLWIGAIIAFIADMKELSIAICLVNLITGTFSFWQEFRANKATEALKKMLPSYAHVIREGKEEKILAEDLTIGDLMLLEEGDKISADACLIEVKGLRVDQSALTGESKPVRKFLDEVLTSDLNKAEIPNLIFAGTNVSEGNAKAVVTKIGMSTEFGKIAKLTQTMGKEVSPLQKKLNRLTKQISFMAISFGLFFFLASVFIIKQEPAVSFIFALGMIVAFIPEGLLPTVTLSLAMSVQVMSKRNALVKKLSSVETLGSTTVICTDKTGTLTQNEMTVSNIWMIASEYEVTGVGYAGDGIILKSGVGVTAETDSDVRTILTAAALCSNARILPPNEETPTYTVLGDPTEACLEVVAQKAGLDMKKQEELTPRIWELPFESRRKRMTTIHKLDKSINGADRIAYMKGAPKEVLQLCTETLENGIAKQMNADDRSKIINENDAYAKKGLRVLAIAYRFLKKEKGIPSSLSEFTTEKIEKNMVFVGLVAMADPPRIEVAKAVEKCCRAGIRIIMITGDYGLTAESIAKRIGIIKGNSPSVVTGNELIEMEDNQLREYLKGEVIFARMVPEQKLRVVSCLQEMDEVVAVTGDGVNDSPALKKADIGVAMGISGTDVAKEAADMILTDDNFASIVHAIEEGRTVYSNIQKFMLYILNSNVPEALPSALFLFSRGAIPLPLTLMQILAIDLGTDIIPALGLGTEKPEEGIMDIPPRNKNESLLTKKLFLKAFLWYGILEGIALSVSYFFVNYTNGWPAIPLASEGSSIYIKATTMSLAAIVFCQIPAVFNSRTEKQSVFKVGLFSNRQINIGIISELIIIFAISYTPFLQMFFKTSPLEIEDWIFLCIWPPIILLLEEIRKWIVRKRVKYKYNRK